MRAQHALPRGVALNEQRAAHPKKKPYKIVLEAVTQEKKKLNSILTYASNAPTGFGFIPAGHPEVTEWCKEQCRQRNLDVHIVSAKPKSKMHADPEKLSHHVHRVGHHFPLEIVQLACSKFGYTYNKSHGLRKARTSDRINWIARSMEKYSTRQQALHGRPSTEKETKDYIHGAVREMFPKIPEADLSSIVNHAFQEGTNRVGNAKELSLARRVQLAVVAHIRHTYTDYDKLLKTDGWMTARSQVEHISLAKLKEWRDEVGEQSNELEETFREVIVLDDDDDQSSDGESPPFADNREHSMEIISNRATARDLQPERYIDYPHISLHNTRRAPRPTIVMQRPLPPPPPPSRTTYSGSSSLQPPFEVTRTLAHSVDSRPSSRLDAYRFAHSRPSDPRSRTPSVVSQPSPQTTPIMREIDGRLYQLQPIEEPGSQSREAYYQPSHHSSLQYAQDRSVPYPVRRASLDRPPAHCRLTSDQEAVLPTVERDQVDLTSPWRVDRHQRQSPRDSRLPRVHPQIQSPKRKAFQPLSYSRPSSAEQSSQHIRPVHYNEDSHRYAYQDDMSPMFSRQAVDTREPPRSQFIDLTASPHHPLKDRVDVPGYSRMSLLERDRHSYCPTPAPPPPPREASSVYYRVPVDAPPRVYMPETRIQETRAPPPDHDSIRRRDVRQPPYVADHGARYLRSGLRYGG